jgi:hypothetical protein
VSQVQRLLHLFDGLITLDQLAHGFHILGLPEQKGDLDLASRRDQDGDLQRGRGVETRSRAVIETHPAERRGRGERTVAP